MARIVIAGAGAIGASIAYQLALHGADDVVLADLERVAAGATGKAMGGVRQQFSTEAEVRLARESIGFFEELGEPLFEQVGYMFLATTEDGLAALEQRVELQRGLGVPVQSVDAGWSRGCTWTTCSARSRAGRTVWPTRRASRVSSWRGPRRSASICAKGSTRATSSGTCS